MSLRYPKLSFLSLYASMI